MRKAYKITTIVLVVLIVLIAVATALYLHCDYPWFSLMCTKGQEIAGLQDGFVPQGLAYDSIASAYLTSGYMDDNSASRIYISYTDQSQADKYITLTNNGSAIIAHFGGIATDGTYCWLTHGYKLYRISCQDIHQCYNGGSIEILDYATVANHGAYLTIYNDQLWVGEYYNDSYPTIDSHHITTPCGDSHGAIAYCYTIDHSQPYALASTTPTMALSTTDEAQGMAIQGNTVILSCSYSHNDSHLYMYNIDMTATTTHIITADECAIPLYFADSSNMAQIHLLPPMSEGITIVDNTLYILYESGATQYSNYDIDHLSNIYYIAL